MGLKRYLAYSLADFKHMLSHRAFVITSLLTIPLSILTMFIVWNVVYDYADTEVIGLFTREQMINYSILSITMLTITHSNGDNVLSRSIRRGDLVKNLVRPEQFYWNYLFRSLGWRLGTLLITVIPALIISALFFGFRVSNYLFAVLGSLSFFLAYLLNYSFTLLLGLLAFKITEYGNISWLRSTIIRLLAGGIVSLTLFPVIFQRVMDYLPFQHMLYTPVRMFIGSYDLLRSFVYLAIQVLWFVVLFVLMKYGWHKAVKSFTGVGA